MSVALILATYERIEPILFRHTFMFGFNQGVNVFRQTSSFIQEMEFVTLTNED